MQNLLKKNNPMTPSEDVNHKYVWHYDAKPIDGIWSTTTKVRYWRKVK